MNSHSVTTIVANYLNAYNIRRNELSLVNLISASKSFNMKHNRFANTSFDNFGYHNYQELIGIVDLQKAALLHEENTALFNVCYDIWQMSVHLTLEITKKTILLIVEITKRL